MLTSYDFTLYEYLKKTEKVCNITSDKSETVIRCPFCGDSTNEYHAHLYIHNNPPFKYYCFKCSTSGVADKKFLKELQCYDRDLTIYLEDCKHEHLKNLNKKYGENFLNIFKKEFDLLPNQYTKIELQKIKYINDRLGININSDDLINKYKIILNIEDFFNNNNLKLNNFYKENLNLLKKDYIGFLLNDKNMICFRDITGKPKNQRYINKKIYDDSAEQSRKFYSISNEINLLNNIYNIYMTEGIFDIIGLFNHVYNCKLNSNDLFISCNGKSYNFVLNYLKTLGILNCNIFIYSDKDVSKNKIVDMVSKNILIKLNGAKLFYNTIGKDYGVKKDEIKISSEIII